MISGFEGGVMPPLFFVGNLQFIYKTSNNIVI